MKRILVVDVGGTSVKILATGQSEPRRFPSGKTMTPRQMVTRVKALAADWKYDAVSVGYPGLVVNDRIAREPHNLAPRWIGFDFARAFGCPVRIINDAAMQALGSYRNGTMLFLGLGTGLGSALVADGVVIPMELAHLSYKDGTYEDYLGIRGVERLGEKVWRKHVMFCVARLISALHLDDVVLGGGNTNRLKVLPEGCRAGDNAYAFVGGFRMWQDTRQRGVRPAVRATGKQQTPRRRGAPPAATRRGMTDASGVRCKQGRK